MPIEIILDYFYTKADIYGNVYGAMRITNPITGLSFTTRTPSENNVTCVLRETFGRHLNAYSTNKCTGSARLSSLPESIYLNCCEATDGWKDNLRKIGYTVP